jgi:pyridoxine 5-phosphate synthase
VIRRLAEAGIRVSCFIDADLAQVAASHAAGAQVVELHTGAYCQAVRERRPEAAGLLENLKAAATEAHRLGLEVHAGHGIDYETVKPIAAIPELMELNIGHFLIGEAIFIGLGPAIQRMRALMDEARATRAA